MSYFAGIDIGGTNVEIGILNSAGDILGKKSIKTDSKKGPEDTFKRIWNTTKELIKELNLDENNLEAIGLGIPGPVVDNSIVKLAANFSWNDNFPAKDMLEKISGKPVKVGNDVKLIALGEYLFGAGRGYKNSITIPIGTGIAAGIILNGEVIDGAGGAAGEFGHIVVDKNGYQCGCGLRGCLETYCSATGIAREAKKRLYLDHDNLLYKKIAGDIESVEAKDVFDAAKAGDEFSTDIADFFCEHMAEGIGILLNTLNPEIIIFSGGVSKAGEILIEGVKKHLPKYALRMTLDQLKFSIGELGEEAGIKGAAALVINLTNKQ